MFPGLFVEQFRIFPVDFDGDGTFVVQSRSWAPLGWTVWTAITGPLSERVARDNADALTRAASR